MDETQTQSEPNFGGSTVDASTAELLTTAIDAASDNAEQPGAEIQPEQVAAPTPEQKAQEEKFAARFAALSRKEKQIRAQEAKVQQQMAELEAKVKALESGRTEVETFKALPDRLKREPLKVLEEQGLTFEQLAQMVLNDGKPTQDMVLAEYDKKVMSRIEELQKKIEEKEKQEQEQKYEQAIQAFQTQLSDFIEQTPDYELIRANNGMEIVFDVIERHHEETGEIMSNKEACDAVEEYLLEEAKKLVDREKVKKLLQPQQPEKPAAPSGKAPPTLSNAQAAQASKNVARKLSDEESKAEAAKLLKWND